MADENKSTRKEEIGRAEDNYAQLEAVYIEVSRDMPNSADKSDVLSRISGDLNRTEEKLERARGQSSSVGYGY
jgi:hypothetical protein